MYSVDRQDKEIKDGFFSQHDGFHQLKGSTEGYRQVPLDCVESGSRGGF